MNAVGARSLFSPLSSILLLTLVLAPLTWVSVTADDEFAEDPEAEARGRLDVWRQIQELCEKATRGETADARIENCESFLRDHGGHHGGGEAERFLKTLIDSYLEKEDHDPARVGELVEMLAAYYDRSYSRRLTLVANYHIKHQLPLDSGRRVLDMARDLIDRERKELWKIDDEQRRKRSTSQLDFSETRAMTLEGELRLVHDDAGGALKMLERAESSSGKFAQGVLVSGEGRFAEHFSTGVLDSLYLNMAVAHARLGRNAEARDYYERTLGFFADEREKRLAEEVRERLDLTPIEATAVSVEPDDAPGFTLKDLDGNEVSLADYRGKVVILNFWATWCGPCIREMPMLKQFADKHRDKGLEVLALNTDRVNNRSMIRPFLETNNIPFRVLLEDPEQLTGYDYSGIPALYVVDREGKIALSSIGYNPDMKEKLEEKAGAILDGEPTPPRPLFRFEQAPEGFGVLWKQSVEGDIQALAIAEPVEEQAGEIGAVGREGLMRWTSDGTYVGGRPLQVRRVTGGIFADDLDNDGDREWIVADYSELKVLDGTGKPYWSSEPGIRRYNVAAIENIDGDEDGTKEIVLSGSDGIVAMRFEPVVLWRNEEFKELQALVRTPGNGLVAQVDDKLRNVDAKGTLSSSSENVPEDYRFCGSIDCGKGRDLTFFASNRRGETVPELQYDINGDRRNDIVISRWNGLVVYDAVDGSTILRIVGDDTYFQTALGDLDGKPGDEVALFVEQYGLVVLGRSQPARLLSRLPSRP